MQTGVADWVMSGVRRILAPNPSPMTGLGTNSYLVGSGGGLVLIDPGPEDLDHLAAVLGALTPGEQVRAIVVTHAHIDHTALVPRMKSATGAPVYAFGPAAAGRSAVMEELFQSGLSSGGEGVDHEFQPDRRLADGDVLSGDWGDMRAWHTPGHMGCHLSLEWNGALFSGDHVMGWSTSLVSPPDGDMTAYVQSLERLRARDWALMLPGHGPAIRHTGPRLDELIAHRRLREEQILASLGEAPGTPRDLASRIYADTPTALLPAATRNVLAHLIDLTSKSRVTAEAQPGPDTIFHLLR